MAIGKKHGKHKKTIGKKFISSIPVGLKYGGRALGVAGTLMGNPAVAGLGAGAEQLGSALEK